jgi:hypothetical protein
MSSNSHSTSSDSPVAVTLARMLAPLEEHPVTRIDRRVNDAERQIELKLSYAIDGQQVEFSVRPGEHPADVVGGRDGDSALLPGPIAGDLLVLIGEHVNRLLKPTRRSVNGAGERPWDFDSHAARTISFRVADVLRTLRRSDSRENYRAVGAAAERLAKLRIEADGRAWRTGKGKERQRIIMGLIDKLVLTEPEGEWGTARLEMTLSYDFARSLAESQRLLDSTVYWKLETAPARRLYRLLDLEFYRRGFHRRRHDGHESPSLRIPVHYLRDRIPIDRTKTAQIIRALTPWHEELVQVGFLLETPVFDDTSVDDLLNYPTTAARSTKLRSAVYRMRNSAESWQQSTALKAPAPTVPAPLPPPSAPTAMELADKMAHLMAQLPGADRHIGLCKVAAESIPDDDTFFRLVATARQEHGGLPPVAAFAHRTITMLRERGISIPSKLLDRDTQVALLRDNK